MESLLSDETILKTSKLWSEAMAEFCEKETFKEVKYDDILEESDHISDDCTPDQTVIDNDRENENENQNENKCKALVKMDNFEGNTSSDDFDECANQTLALMREQQERWQKNGMLKVLQTFDWDQISKVVVPWVEQNKLDRSQLSTSVDEHIVHIEEHHHRQVHMSSDDDSLHSLDTANYIRASRKKKRTSCTTTTIKKFSYVKGSRRHLQKKYGLDLDKDLEKIFHQKFPENAEKIAHRGLKAITAPEKGKTLNCTPPARQNPIEYEPRSLPTRRRKSRQMKRRSDICKRYVSRSSSSSDSPMQLTKPKHKRLSKTNSEEASHPVQKAQHRVPEPEVEIDLTKLETSCSEKEILVCTKNKGNGIPKSQVKPSMVYQSASFSNDTGFLGASIINSTAMPSNSNPPSVLVPIKKCQLTPIKNNPKPEWRPGHAKIKPKVRVPRVKIKKIVKDIVERKEIEKTKIPEEEPKEIQKTQLSEQKIVDQPSKEEIAEPKESKKTQAPIEEIVEPEKIEETQVHKQMDKSKILLFSPTDLSEPLRKNLSSKRFYLTKDYFLEKVGQKQSRRFIKLNSKKFPFVFDWSSTIFFILPEESDESASSDEDILDIFGREGKFLVETAPAEEAPKDNSNNNKELNFL